MISQNDTSSKDKQRYEEQQAELKKLRKEISKQRTVIEWLEGELVAAKDEKIKIQNRFVAVEQRITNLLTYKGEKNHNHHFSFRQFTKFCRHWWNFTNNGVLVPRPRFVSIRQANFS